MQMGQNCSSAKMDTANSPTRGKTSTPSVDRICPKLIPVRAVPPLCEPAEAPAFPTIGVNNGFVKNNLAASQGGQDSQRDEQRLRQGRRDCAPRQDLAGEGTAKHMSSCVFEFSELDIFITRQN